MAPSTDQAQLESSLQHLNRALEAAKTYYGKSNIEPEVLLIHINFVSNRIAGVEKTVSSINRRNKNDDLMLPDEAEEANDFVRDLQIKRTELMKAQEQRDRALIAEQVSAANAAQQSQIQQPVQVLIKKPPLPPLPIPRFDGDAMQYHNFITIFDETVDKNETLVPSQKLAYLQSFVDGEAKRLIGHILVVDSNYEIARNTLKLNFGHTAQNITHLYDKLHDIPMARNDPFSIRDTYNEIENILQMLEHAGVSVNEDNYLRHSVLKKWPFSLMRQIVREEAITLKKFREEIGKEVALQIQLTQATGYTQTRPARPKPYNDRPNKAPYNATSSATSNATNTSTGTTPSYASAAAKASNGANTRRPQTNATNSGGTTQQHPAASNVGAKTAEKTDESTPSAVCPFCKEHHHAENCTRYKTAQQRMEMMGNRCVKCFRAKHDGMPCIRNIKCRYCPSYDHNRALCPIKYTETDPKYLFTQQSANQDPSGLFMTLLVRVTNPDTKKSAEMRLLLDPACNRTAMTEKAAAKIGISSFGRAKKPTKGMGERQVEPVTEDAVQISVDVQNEEPIQLAVRLTARIADDVPVYDIDQFRQRYSAYGDYYIPPTGAGQPVDIIMGSDKLLRFLMLDKCVCIHQTCQLLATKFGWIIMAEDTTGRLGEDRNLFSFSIEENDGIRFMHDLDLVGMKGLDEPELAYEERALQIFYHSIKFVDGRYEVHWPWRNYPPNLDENYGLAMGRLKTLLKKLNEKPELLAAYHQIILEQIDQGIVEDVPKGGKTGAVVHYIPHHAVVVTGKSTPVRVVYDGSATPAKNKKSLNSHILKGSKWLGNTVGSLVRFRRFGQAVTSDIKHAFHQISISPMDRDAVRFIWLHDVKQPPTGPNLRILRFRRVAFGIVASPFLLYATIQYHLRKNQTQYTDILCREMYADNLLVSLPNRIDAIDFYKTSKTLFSSMSMDLTKWKSNVDRLTQAIPQEDAITEKEISVLGLAWTSNEDTLAIRQPRIAHLEKVNPSKRVVLKTMASIFDPLGWIAPFILTLRLFYRKIWLQKRKWDDALTNEDLATWNYLRNEIAVIPSIKLPRMYFRNECGKEASYELHTFVDASADAVGNVTYLRLASSDPEIALVMAKTRLSPDQKMTIPRLEFYAMVLGIRTQSYIAEHIDLEIKKRYIWSDSKCVLAWVASSKLLPAAIEKHMKEIREAKIFQFRYVATAINPADIVSRGATLTDLKSTSWFQGPEWLISTEDWPAYFEPNPQDIPVEPQPQAMFIQGQHAREVPAPFFLNPDDFSEWKRLLRRTAHCIFLMHLRLKRNFLKVQTPIDYNMARMLWIRWDQRRNGSSEPEIVRSISHFKNVKILVDEFGIIRCSSRLKNSHLPWEAVEPIVLVKGSKITEMIVLDIHQRNYHVGTSQTLSTLRKHYWLIHGRREVYRIIHQKCLKCRKYDAKPYAAQEIPPLPPFRIKYPSRPFENTGIDVFGPIYVYSAASQNKEKVKRWVLLFTCLVIRAVHFEVLSGMDTQDVLCAIKKFVARRGTPALILSDNAPQFHLVNGVTQELWENFSNDVDSNSYFAEEKIMWKFTPQNAPWMGGAYERLVQVTKNAFRRTYGEQTVSEREFDTTIIEIEAVINNRPITYVDKELNSPLLTPNKFLQVSFPAIPINIDERHDRSLSTRKILVDYWKAAEEHMNFYWQIWSEQYLLAVREIKNKEENSARREPKVGDIVLLIDPSLRRGHWRKGIVERLIPSADEKHRSAQVRLSSGTRMIRPIVKLVPMDFLEAAPEIVSSSVASGEDVVDVSPTDPSEVDVGPGPIVIASGSGSCKL